MCRGTRGRARVGAGAMVIALVSGGCSGSGSRPTLEEAAATAGQVDPLGILAEVDGTDAGPTPSAPVLLSRDRTPADSLVPTPLPTPGELAFEVVDPTLVDGSMDPEGASATDEPEAAEQGTDAVGATDAVPDTEETGEVGADGDPAADGGAESAQDADTGGAATDLDLPPPPPAVVAAPPLYEDPSEMIVAASGRAFPLYPSNELGLTVRGVADDAVRVGGLATQSLVGNPYRADVCRGARARYEQANASAELSREIDFVDCFDDTGRGDLAAELAALLVRSDVFAIAPMASPVFLDTDLVRDERVTYVGDDALPTFCGRDTGTGFGIFGAQGCPVLDARGYTSIVEPVLTAYGSLRGEMLADLTYVVVAGPDGAVTAASRLFEAELLEIAPPTILEVLPTAAEGQPAGWDAIVAGIMETQPDVVVLDGPRVAGLPRALRAAGFAGELVLVGAMDPLIVADPDQRIDWAPLTVITPGLDVADRTTPGWVALEGAAAALGLEPAEIGLDFVEGYVAADFLVRALAATPEPLSTEALANTLNDGWWYGGIDGLACGSWWPASHFVEVPCVSVSRLDLFSDTLTPELGLVETEPQLRFGLAD